MVYHGTKLMTHALITMLLLGWLRRMSLKLSMLALIQMLIGQIPELVLIIVLFPEMI